MFFTKILDTKYLVVSFPEEIRVYNLNTRLVVKDFQFKDEHDRNNCLKYDNAKFIRVLDREIVMFDITGNGLLEDFRFQLMIKIVIVVTIISIGISLLINV